MRAAIVVVALALLSACTKPCKEGTMLLTAELSGGAEQADSLVVSVRVGAGAPVTTPLDHTAGDGSGTVEVDFPAGYPTGQMVRVDILARRSGVTLGLGSGSTTAVGGCSALTIAIMPVKCNPGQQDNDDDGVCRSDCATAALICPTKTRCSDASGTAVCVCSPGYALLNSTCVWQEIPKDSEFRNMPAGAWTVSAGGVIEPNAAGVDAPGNLHFDVTGICQAGVSARQQITMPAFAESEPFALQTVAKVDCDSSQCKTFGSDGGVNVRINGGMHLFNFLPPTLTKLRVCLGERAYGGIVAVDIVPSDKDSCSFKPSKFDIRVDQAVIVPDATCPTPGTIPNADFEGSGGWGSYAVNGSAGIAAGQGVAGSAGGRLTTALSSSACSDPSLTGKVSAPFRLPNAALAFSFKGTAGKTATLGLWTAWATLTGTGTFVSTSLCIPEHAKGVVLPLYFTTRGCDSDTRDMVIDNFTFVSDNTCPAVNLISDGGFERNRNEWNINSDAVAGAVVTNASQAHTGMRSLQLSVGLSCTRAIATTFITVPEPVGNAGPAVKYFYKAPIKNNTTIFVTSTPMEGFLFNSGKSDEPPAAGIYTARTLCLDPVRAGQGMTLEASLYGLGFNCTTFATETVSFDDFVVTTDPSCPAK